MAAEGRGAPLKLIVMSATLRTEDFVGNRRLFPVVPPLVHVPARQYPVTLHFSKKTELHDYVGVAFSKVEQIVVPPLPMRRIFSCVTSLMTIDPLSHAFFRVLVLA